MSEKYENDVNIYQPERDDLIGRYAKKYVDYAETLKIHIESLVDMFYGEYIDIKELDLLMSYINEDIEVMNDLVGSFKTRVRMFKEVEEK